MYRYVRQTPLDTGHKYGDIIRDGELPEKSIKLFLVSGTIIKVSSPPLSEIPTFEKRADELNQLNIITISDLIEADAKQIAIANKKSIATIRRWQSEAMQWLAPPDTKKED